MTTQANFTLRGRNPDVLTCIANLSNDGVFPPPEFAPRMPDTLAMFLVGGGIIAHGIPPVHHLIEALTAGLGFFKGISVAGLQGIVGLLCGSVVLAGIMGVQRVRGKTV